MCEAVAEGIRQSADLVRTIVPLRPPHGYPLAAGRRQVNCERRRFVITARQVVKALVPPLITYGYRRLRNSRQHIYGLSGDYGTWDDALRASTGYDTEIVLERTKAALLQVKSGQVAYERDSVV